MYFRTVGISDFSKEQNEYSGCIQVDQAHGSRLLFPSRPACEKVLESVSPLLTPAGAYLQITCYDYICRRKICNLGYSVHTAHVPGPQWWEMEKMHVERQRNVPHIDKTTICPHCNTFTAEWGGSLDNDVVNMKHFQVIEQQMYSSGEVHDRAGKLIYKLIGREMNFSPENTNRDYLLCN